MTLTNLDNDNSAVTVSQHTAWQDTCVHAHTLALKGML
jgi:hypothetical protein